MIDEKENEKENQGPLTDADPDWTDADPDCAELTEPAEWESAKPPKPTEPEVEPTEPPQISELEKRWAAAAEQEFERPVVEEPHETLMQKVDFLKQRMSNITHLCDPNWEPIANRPLEDLEIVALAYRECGRYVKSGAAIDDPELHEAMYQRTYETYGTLMSDEQYVQFKWTFQNCMYQYYDHILRLSAGRAEAHRQSQAAEAQSIIDQATRPDKRKDKRRGRGN